MTLEYQNQPDDFDSIQRELKKSNLGAIDLLHEYNQTNRIFTCILSIVFVK